MKEIKIIYPDGSEHVCPEGITPRRIAEEINDNNSLRALVAEVNGILVDMNHPIDENARIAYYNFDDEIGREVYWHSTSHLMAQAVKQLFPEVKVAIGPAIENGFYYDFERDQPFTDEDLVKIEEKMMELAGEKLEYVRQEIARSEAIKRFKKAGEPYKVEILEDLPKGERVSLYTQGEFTDLCRGPHLVHTGKIRAVKLLRTSGAYWRGNENNKMLKRIYGISFPNPKDLKKHLLMLEEAKKRDHRKLGRELDLFSINEDVGPGLVLWHPNGAMIRCLIEDYWRKKHFEAGYKLVYSPHIGKAQLWKTSGHLGFYREGMFDSMKVEDQEYYLKPMNCPFHIMIYKSRIRSYRDLPIKYAELGTVYRYERSGVLHGLMRVRGFTQDDAHIICREDQLVEEVEKLLGFSMDMLRTFGFTEFMVYVATRPVDAIGDIDDWDKATHSLKSALEKNNIGYKVDEGGGAFYGPKIDIHVKDALNRKWQLTTIQFDFNESARFEMEYVGADNQPHRPYMIHRALLGSIERFFGILIEHHAGNFPTWLCPVQVMMIPVSENFERYAQRELKRLRAAGVRAEIDVRNDKIGAKIRESEMQKIPFMFIVGQKEEDANGVSVRRHGAGDQGMFSLDEAIRMVQNDNGKVKTPGPEDEID
jgi:threonyl-tRNA synthetase